jgi:rare lipoprotein A
VPAPLAVPSPELAKATATAGRGFWIQLGAYRERQGAEQMQAQASTALDGIAPKLTVFSDNLLYRVQAGPFASREDAARAAERVREKLLLVPLVVERR